MQTTKVLLSLLWVHHSLLLMQGVLLWSSTLLPLKCIRPKVPKPPPQTSPPPVPPPAPESPIPFSNAENIPLACCANPPAPRAPLQPIDKVVSDAEDSDVVAERLEDRIGEESALRFLTGSSQGRGACRRAVRGLARRSAPYPHRMQPGDHSRPRSFELEGERLQR